MEPECAATRAYGVRLDSLIGQIMPEVHPVAPETDKPGVEHHQSRLDGVFGNLEGLAPQSLRSCLTKDERVKSNTGRKPCDSQGIHLEPQRAQRPSQKSGSMNSHRQFQRGATRTGYTSYQLDRKESAKSLGEQSVLGFINEIREQKGKRALEDFQAPSGGKEAAFGVPKNSLRHQKRRVVGTGTEVCASIAPSDSLKFLFDVDDTMHTEVTCDERLEVTTKKTAPEYGNPHQDSSVPAPISKVKFRRSKPKPSKARHMRNRCSSSDDEQQDEKGGTGAM